MKVPRKLTTNKPNGGLEYCIFPLKKDQVVPINFFKFFPAETPFCGNLKQVSVVTIPVGESLVKLECAAQFVPSTPDDVVSSLGFDWVVNTTANVGRKSSRPVSSDLYSVNATHSSFAYKMGASGHKASTVTVICVPFSSVGVSSKPCIFHVVSTGKPMSSFRMGRQIPNTSRKKGQ